MTQDEIIEMARQTGLAMWHKDLKKIQLEYGVEAFAKLVAAKERADEREACAKVCDALHYKVDAYGAHCAEAIRARAQADGGEA